MNIINAKLNSGYLGIASSPTPPREAAQNAKEAALTVEIDPMLAEAHTSLAIVKTDYD